MPSASAVEEYDSSALEEWERTRLPMVKMVKVPERSRECSLLRFLTTAQEILGPEFGDGFVDACLQHYNDSVEHVVAHVFDGSLHPSLQSLDQGMDRPTFTRVVQAVAPSAVPYTVQDAAESRQVVKVHYGKKYAHLVDSLSCSFRPNACAGRRRRRKRGSLTL